ncbi:MOSC domain-containing protein [Noviherbaspirillum suwonense]|jgi:MOSC domain-containing protein YiiM|uniref:MOSC domain-containing protein YiiM n=1 Tax=Noviherbaspirillum suwonense TaxID=1224511 RepID=A0ABY1QBZ9_9BURK|nr:MOSC domain-containing protein [Noviherbaspirillum suwonense]SMP67016.1 MOSC domain-containing protein YiiM [Noviherbaspirillum suwonense]
MPNIDALANFSLRGKVVAVSSSEEHLFSKTEMPQISLLEGYGVEGDAHAGTTVQHRSRVAQDPSQANLRQVHLIHCELHNELVQSGYPIKAGELGENITTEGIDLLGLPVDSLLCIGTSAVVRITGLRNPCAQIDNYMPGLLKEVVSRDRNGIVIRKAGVMSVVSQSGTVRPGDLITIQLPPPPYRPLERV